MGFDLEELEKYLDSPEGKKSLDDFFGKMAKEKKN